MFKNKEIELKPMPKINKIKEQTEIVVKLAPTLNDKIEVLDNFYLWLFSNGYDANNGAILTKYKQILKQKENKNDNSCIR